MAAGNGKVTAEEVAEVIPPVAETPPAATPPVRRRGRPPGSAANSDGIKTPRARKTAAKVRPVSTRMTDDKPIFTLSVAAEILALHPRTLRIYEEEKLVVPFRTQTARRRYSQNDINKFRFIQYLTRTRHVNLAGVRLILDLMADLKSCGIDATTTHFADYTPNE